MPPHVQQYVLRQMSADVQSDLRGGSSDKDRAMETAIKSIGLDAGVSAFWQELKRSSKKHELRERLRNAAAELLSVICDTYNRAKSAISQYPQYVWKNYP